MKKPASTFYGAARPGVMLLLTVGIALFPGLLPAAVPHGTALSAAHRALERWDTDAAGDALAVLDGESSPALDWTRGILSFYRGEYDEASRQMEKAGRDLPAEEPFLSMASLVRANLRMASSLSSYESEHFIVSLDASKDWVLAEPALETLERAWQSLGSWLGHHPGEKVRVEIVPAVDLFEEVSSLTVRDIRVSGAIGICKFNKIMLMSPRLLLRGYRWRDSLVHEYAHYLLVGLSANMAPIWLQEGVARYGETLWRSDPPLYFTRADEGLIAEALADGSLIAFSEMDPSLVRLPSLTHVRLAFAQCALAVDYFLDTWGIEGLRSLLAELSGGGSTDGAMRRAVGSGLEDFERKWRDSIAERGYRPLEGLQVRQLRLASESSGSEEWDLEYWQNMEGRRYLKLGDMLRARKRHKPALREYAKAARAAPASPLVLNRVVRALLALQRYDEAEARAVEAAEIHPDFTSTYANLAAARGAQGDWRGAEDALRESLDINPFDPFVWKDLGNLLLSGGRIEEGEKALSTAGRLGGAALQ
jgi:tetratricopeptide (TPR) repeat protein